MLPHLHQRLLQRWQKPISVLWPPCLCPGKLFCCLSPLSQRRVWAIKLLPHLSSSN
jgi:hypothetical protein